jgi:aryl-alcohol dehydrogenase-like predicted oxidoreductase
MTMAQRGISSSNRRKFLQAGALVAASATAGAANGSAQDTPPAPPTTLPKRPLGKTGAQITLLDIGTGRGRGVGRLLRYAYAQGIRAFDTSAVYQSEPDFKAWFQQEPAVRKEVFIVTKEHEAPGIAAQLKGMIDARCAAMGTDYIDLFFAHSFGDNGIDASLKLLKSPEFKAAAEAAKKSAKLKLFGISTHHRDRAVLLQTAAEVGYIDAIMVQYSPWLDKESALSKALDACHERGIGLISMKQIAGRLRGGETLKGILDAVQARVPTLEERKLSPFQGLLHAIWSDERISAACVAMANTDQVRENADAARRYEPLKTADIERLRDAVLAQRMTFCADCEGRCATAAGTQAALGELTRFLTYHEHHGHRSSARQLYAALPAEARDWSGADLEAARAACPNHLDFAALLPEVDKRLA